MTTTADDMEIAVTVPGQSSHVVTPDGVEHLVEVDGNGRRFVKIKAGHARMIINGGTPESLAWKSLNTELAQWLGRPPKIEAGINISRLQHAAWEASRPTTIVEDLARMRSAMRGGWR